MSARRIIIPLLFLAACTDDAIVGPFTGEVHRFTVDAFDLPNLTADVREMGTDLDGQGEITNALGWAVVTLWQYGGDAQRHVPDLIASGVVASAIEIQADDLQNDPSVGVTFYGHDGAPARVVGGRIEDGVFKPNRIAKVDGTVTGQGVLVLPAFADADPLELEAVTLEIKLIPDATGYSVHLYGAVRSPEIFAQAHDAIAAQIANHPETHRSIWTLADRNLDGVVTADEMESGVVFSYLAPDVELSIDGTVEKVLSFGFHLHAMPCASGQCIDAPVATCFDRVRNGGESDVDCGGSCAIACSGGRTCAAADDCQSQSCNAGTCAQVTCTDGVKNGLEASLDCGGACGTKCLRGAVCGYDFDCASGNCTATSSTGTCQ